MTNDKIERVFMHLPLGYAYHEIIFENNRQEYVLMDANDVFFHFWGLDKEKAIKKNVSKLLYDTCDSPSWYSFYKNLHQIEDRHPVIQIGTRSLKVTAYYPCHNGVVTIFDDITEIMMELKLEKEKNEKLARDTDAFFESTQDGLFLVAYDNGEFRYIRNNTVHQQLTGITIQLLEGKTPVEVMGDKAGTVLQDVSQKTFGRKKLPQQHHQYPFGNPL